MMKSEHTNIITRKATPRITRQEVIPTFWVRAFAMGGIMTELSPYVAVAIPPTSPFLSGKNFTELLIVHP